MEAAVEHMDARPPILHEPAMAVEVAALLLSSAPKHLVDATVGTGGHAELLMASAPADARLLGLDRDPQALEVARVRLSRFGARVLLRQARFSGLGELLGEAGFESADAILADLGMSSFALDDPARGFSFMREGPLDMRMSPDQGGLRAYDIVNEEGEAQLARILYELGEERASRRLARAIVEARRDKPLETTGDLRRVIEGALGGHRRGGVHPATRTFQALRIAVNGELEELAALLERAPGRLGVGGRLAIIAYHSLEDRAVKHRFRALAHQGDYALVTRKVLRPEPAEVERNPRARSARVRCLERVR